MKKKALFALLWPALATGLAAATEGGAAHVDWFGVLAKVFNSTVLFGGLFLLLRKPLIRMLSQKSSDIQADIMAREKNLAEAETLLQEVRERLAKVAAEVETIKNGANAAGKDEMARLEAAGRLEAERIIAMSEEEIRQRVDSAVRAVRERIADLAIERFRDDFGKSLDAATQQKIIERNIDACGDLSHEGAGHPIGGLDEGK
jgi:F-type H+-transporting ATPase subunit b